MIVAFLSPVDGLIVGVVSIVFVATIWSVWTLRSGPKNCPHCGAKLRE